MRTPLIATATLIGLTVCAWTDASPITWHMTGEVGTGNLGSFFFPFTVSPGDPIAIDFTFESEAPCSFCEDTFKIYDNPLTAITFTVHDTPFALPLEASSIGIVNDRPSPAGFFVDAFQLSSFGTDSSGITFLSSLAVQNTAPTAPVPGFDSVELKDLQPPDPSLFADPSLSFWDFSASFDGGFDQFGGQFKTASVVTMPEPSTLALLASGTMLVGFFRCRRRCERAH